MADKDLYSESGPEPMISTKGMALLMGVTEEAMRAEIERQGGGAFRPPSAWIKASQRRAKEYLAATGRDDMRGALDYWQERERG